MRQGRRWVVWVIGLGVLAMPASAGAATQIGQTFTPDAEFSAGFTGIQSGSPGGQYTVPSPGVITSWSFQASAAGVPQGLKLKVARAAGGANFTIVGESPPKNPVANTLNTYTDVRIPVQTGDLLGLFMGSLNANTFRFVDPGSGYLEHEKLGDFAPGTTTAYGGPFDLQLDVSATLEPDCDSDGAGDETQDPNVSSCHPRVLTLDANKNKVKKGKNVTLSGELNQAAEQGGCESGQTVELQRKKPSETTFTTVEQVQTDTAGKFSAKEKVKKTYEYLAQVSETATCGSGLSNTEKVKVKKH